MTPAAEPGGAPETAPVPPTTTAGPALDAHLVLERVGFRLDVALTAPRGVTLGLVGPSGAGKTSALRLLAGVETLDAGKIVAGGEVWDDPRSGRLVPAHRRHVGWVPQGGALLPHLDALANAAFGLRRRGIRRRDATRRARRWLERMGLGDLVHARPETLSGGETRRVALARALATEPRVLLLDEPLAGVDVATRAALRPVLREALAAVDGARVLVVHEPVDAFGLADHLVVVEGGRVVQEGSADDLVRHPATRYVAEMAGVNLLHGTGGLRDGRPVVDVDAASGGGVLRVAEVVDGPVVAVFRPSAVALHRQPPAGSPRNVVEVMVAEVVPSGERVRVRVDGHPAMVAELTREAVASLDVRPGERFHASVKATEIDVRPA